MAPKAKVLIVEDEIFLANSLRLDLQDHGYQVVKMVPDGESAIEIAGSEKPDVVLMDIRLNGVMTGLEAGAKIKAENALPIVFMTGYVTESIKSEAEKIGCLAFLEKPVMIDELITVLGTLG